MTKIFISHSSNDNIFTLKLATSLKDEFGVEIWVDFDDNPAGIRWNQGVQNGLNECQIMVLIVSPESMVSAHVEHEWHHFLNKKKIVIPIIHKHVENLHYELESIVHTVFYRRPYNKAFKDLCNSLNKHGVKSTKASSPIQIDRAKTGNLFWLCHDLLELYRWLLSGITKEWIDVGLRQSCHHASQLGLNHDLVRPLEEIRDKASKIQESEWTQPNREKFANEVKITFNNIAQAVQAADPNFNSGPG